MKISGLGTDLVDIARVRVMLDRWGDRFVEKVFLPQESNYCRSRPDPAQHYAGRLAAKEAVFKALGEGWTRRLGWKDILVSRNPKGDLSVVLQGKGAELIRQQGVGKIYLSISHAGEYAQATALAVNRDGSFQEEEDGRA